MENWFEALHQKHLVFLCIYNSNFSSQLLAVIWTWIQTTPWGTIFKPIYVCIRGETSSHRNKWIPSSKSVFGQIKIVILEYGLPNSALYFSRIKGLCVPGVLMTSDASGYRRMKAPSPRSWLKSLIFFTLWWRRLWAVMSETVDKGMVFPREGFKTPFWAVIKPRLICKRKNTNW